MVPVQGAAVPAVVLELVLALPDPLLGPLAYGLHQIRVALAQLPLLVHQAGNVVADHAGPQSSDVPEVDRPTTGISEELLTTTTLLGRFAEAKMAPDAKRNLGNCINNQGEDGGDGVFDFWSLAAGTQRSAEVNMRVWESPKPYADVHLLKNWKSSCVWSTC